MILKAKPGFWKTKQDSGKQNKIRENKTGFWKTKQYSVENKILENKNKQQDSEKAKHKTKLILGRQNYKNVDNT